MSKKTLTTCLLIAALVAIFVVSFALGSGRAGTGEERFGGSDDGAVTAIQESQPGYEPWFQPFFEPASGEIESGLFALQAALGGTVFGFAVGGLWGRRRAERDFALAGSLPPRLTASSTVDADKANPLGADRPTPDVASATGQHE